MFGTENLVSGTNDTNYLFLVPGLCSRMLLTLRSFTCPAKYNVAGNIRKVGKRREKCDQDQKENPAQKWSLLCGVSAFVTQMHYEHKAVEIT